MNDRLLSRTARQRRCLPAPDPRIADPGRAVESTTTGAALLRSPTSLRERRHCAGRRDLPAARRNRRNSLQPVADLPSRFKLRSGAGAAVFPPHQGADRGCAGAERHYRVQPGRTDQATASPAFLIPRPASSASVRLRSRHRRGAASLPAICLSPVFMIALSSGRWRQSGARGRDGAVPKIAAAQSAAAGTMSAKVCTAYRCAVMRRGVERSPRTAS